MSKDTETIEVLFRDGMTYLNWWDDRGRSINCELRDGKILKYKYSASENEELELQGADHDPFAHDEITFKELIDLIKKRRNPNSNG